MAKFIGSAAGRFLGKFANGVGFNWKGVVYAREYLDGSRITNPRTAKQQLQRAKFGLAGSMSGVFKNFYYLLGMDKAATEQHSTPEAIFVKQNLQNISGSTPSDLEVNYTELTLTPNNQKLAAIMPGELDLETPLTIKTSIEESNYDQRFNTQLDTVYLVGYSKTGKEAVISDGNAKRNTGSVEVTVPGYWQGHYVEAWVFVRGNETNPLTRGKVSPTIYVGNGRIL